MQEPSAYNLALNDYLNGDKKAQITILCDLADDDIMDVDYYFRKEKDLPELEKLALSLCHHKVLDVGASVGAHAIPLKEKGHEVTAIDISETAITYLKQKGIKAKKSSFEQYNKFGFQTILLLMNGIGLAGKLNNLEAFLKKCYDMLEEGGNVLCDSTDVRYFYEDDEGALWMDLNAEYYGEFSFAMKYKHLQDEFFNWLYVDEEKLTEIATKVGFTAHKRYQEDSAFLMELIKTK